MAIGLRVYGIDDVIPFALDCLAKYRLARQLPSPASGA